MVNTVLKNKQIILNTITIPYRLMQQAQPARALPVGSTSSHTSPVLNLRTTISPSPGAEREFTTAYTGAPPQLDSFLTTTIFM